MVRDLITELCRLLSVQLPTFLIYDDGEVPQGFTRPALCIVTGEVTRNMLNQHTIEKCTDIVIYIFPELNESGAASMTGLQETIELLCGAFENGFFRVSGRALKIRGGVKSDCSTQDGYVELSVYYTEPTSTQETAPLICSINYEEE